MDLSFLKEILPQLGGAVALIWFMYTRLDKADKAGAAKDAELKEARAQILALSNDTIKTLGEFRLTIELLRAGVKQ